MANTIIAPLLFIKVVMSEKINLSMLSVANVTKTRFIEKQLKNKEWVSYGENNNFPDYLWRQYTDCPTQQAIIDAKTAFTMGNGISGGDIVVNNQNETLEDVLRKCVFDLHLFGGFALQVIFGRGGDIVETYWADFSKCRINQSGTKIYWADSWNGYNVKSIEYDAFNPKMTNKTTQIFYYRGTSCRSIYPVPCYISALDSIATEIEVQHYHLNGIRNGLNVSAIINMNGGVPDEEERKDFERKINEKFSGSDNASKTLISWNESKENACTVERLDCENFSERFAQLSKDTQEAISVAHRLTSLTLIGRLPQNTGFTKNEYREAFDVFNTTVIKPYQKEILGVLKKIYPDKTFNILPFEIAVA